MRPLIVGLVVALALVAGGCSSNARGDALVLDGRPRLPQAEGVVEEVTFTSLTLRGGATYEITRDLQCFSTYTLASVPLLERKGQYVQLGLDGKRVVWLASIGGVVNQQPPTVFYTGHLLRVAEGRAVFRDGTTFAVDASTAVPKAGFVQVAIDPVTAKVQDFF